MGDFFPAPSPSSEGVGGVTLPFFSLLWSTLLLPPVVGVASGGCPAVGVWSSGVSSEDEAAFALKNLPCQTFLLRFLLEGRAAEPSGGYKTFREMPWGEMYIGPYTGRVLTRAAFTFGTRVEKFRAACEAMGALAIPHGDAGFQFDFLGGYRMQLMVYAGDEEFPPSSQVLYSDNFETGFAAEDRVVAGDILISAIKARM